MEARLKTMGAWLKRNGEAIYGTEAGPYPYEISWGTITQRKGEDSTSLYLNVVERILGAPTGCVKSMDKSFYEAFASGEAGANWAGGANGTRRQAE